MIDHEARKSRIGASEVAAILGHNENMSPLDVWLVKTGRAQPFEGNEHTKRGNRQERQILEWLNEELGMGYVVTYDCYTSIHPTSPIAAATPDSIVCDFGILQKQGFEENATAARAAVRHCWQQLLEQGADCSVAEAKSTLKTIASVEDIPTTWIIQCQWQMLCTGLKKAHLAIFGPMVSNYQRFEIAYDEVFALDMLADATEWWEKHVVGDVQPDPISEADVKTLWPIDDGTSIQAVDSLAQTIADYSMLKAQIKDLNAACEPLRDRITLAIGQAKTVRYGGRTIATYAADKNGNRSLRTY